VTEPSEKDKGGPDGEVTGSGIPRYVVPLVVGVSVVSVIVVALKKSEPPVAPPPPSAGSAGIESPYPTCRDIGKLYLERNAELHCASDGFLAVKPICERVYANKPACDEMVKAAYSCLRDQPKSVWQCSPQGALVFDPNACAPQIVAFNRCLER
jgi:hypothetical protein